MDYNNLKSVRTKRGISISELARRTNLSRVTVTEIERGRRNPTIKTIVAICNELNMDPLDIFFDTFVNHEFQKGDSNRRNHADV